MKYKVKWIEDHMSITRNMIRRYEKKGVILRNEKGKDREFDEDDLIQLWNIRVMVSLGFSLDDVKEVLCGSNLREVSEKRLRALNEEYRDLQGKINFLNVVKTTGEMPSCFKVSANNFEEIYNLGLIQYVSPVSNISKHSTTQYEFIVIVVMNRQINMRIIIIQSIRI